MKPKFEGNLICPRCKMNSLRIKRIDKENNLEVVEGILQCISCSRQYPIRDGILELLTEHGIQSQYNANGKKIEEEAINNSAQESLDRRIIAFRKNLDQKWVMSSTENFNQVFRSLELTGSEHVLELGAGTCWAIRQFSERGCKCVAQDLLKYQKLDMAEYWFSEKGVYFERVLADMSQPIFRENSFDLVYSVASMMYSKDVLRNLCEIYRILRRDGKIALIAEPVVAIHRASDIYRQHGSGRAYTIFEWQNYIRDAGFKVIKRFFAQSIRIRLMNPEIITRRTAWYYPVAKLVSRFSKGIFLRNIGLDRLCQFISIFMPMPLMIVAIKVGEKERKL